MNNNKTEIDFDEILKNAIEVKFEMPKGFNLNQCDLMISFANFMYDFRKKHNLTRKQLSLQLDLSVDEVELIESAEKDMSLKKMCIIANKLDYKIDLSFIKKGEF